MRLTINFEVLNETIDGRKWLPIFYRRAFLSLLKRSFTKAGESVFELLYEKWRVKPFTFSVYIPKPVFEKERIFLPPGYNRIKLIFSTCFAEIIEKLFEGLIVGGESIFAYRTTDTGLFVRFDSAQVSKDPDFTSDEITLRMLSPLLVREHEREENRDIFLTLNDTELPRFNEQLNINMEPVFKNFGKNIEDYRLNIEPINPKTVALKVSDDKKNVGVIRGTTGIFKLKGSPQALKLAYQVGLGAKRSYGFGMFALARAKNDG
jgi:CRISPR-associated endoribonuclease Cas6